MVVASVKLLFLNFFPAHFCFTTQRKKSSVLLERIVLVNEVALGSSGERTGGAPGEERKLSCEEFWEISRELHSF